VRQIPFAELDQWIFESPSLDLAHVSGKFFRVEGLRVTTNFGPVCEWEQPIVNQPEVGILGILTQVVGGTRYLLMQAKMEPGNVNVIQLSPTVQATRSNYTQVHKGRLPPYLEYLVDARQARRLVDQLQSEQGGRFLRKRNRNMIVEVDSDLSVPVYDGFCWLTLDQVRRLLRVDNLVNMDARSVLSCFGFLDRDESGPSRDEPGPSREERGARHTMNELVGWLTEMKTRFELHVERIPLGQVSGWARTENEIAHQSGRYFSVIAVAVHAENREVLAWTQPLLKSTHLGLIGFLCQEQNGLLHFVVQAKVEPGNLDVVDLAPTVSCSDAELVAMQRHRPPFFDLLYHAAPHRCRYSAIQSEEGGRFYHLQNRYVVVELDPSDRLALPDNYIWMTGGQMLAFMRHGALNIEARNLLVCLGS